MSTMNLSVVTSNLERGHQDKQLKDDVNWIIKNFKPDVWGLQETKDYVDMLNGLGPAYKLALPKNPPVGSRDNAILYNADRMRLISVNARFAGSGGNLTDRYINVAHFRERNHGVDVYLFNTHIFPHIEVGGHHRDYKNTGPAIDHIKLLAQMVKDVATKDNSATFWCGDFNIDEDADDRVEAPGFMQKTFDKFGLLSIYDELKTPASFDTHDKRKIDIIGSHKADARVKAKGVRRAPKMTSDHRYVEGTYEFSGVKDGGSPKDPTATPGSPTNPEQDPDPTSVKQAFEKDKGSTIDHSDCCGGEYA